jgi:hypothetical protein
VALPDWSQASAAAARTALAAIADAEWLTAKFAGLDSREDSIWQAVLGLYAALGRAPRNPEIAAVAGISPEATVKVLRRLRGRDQVVLDEAGDAVIGAYPFTERKTGHRVRIGERDLNAMCAIDALGAGAMYGRDTAIESSCHECAQRIHIETKDDGTALKAWSPASAVVWAGLASRGGCAATSLCTVIIFFCSDVHLESWRTANPAGPPGYRLSLEEAMQVGKAVFVPMLARASESDR